MSADAVERPPRATALEFGPLADIVGFHLARAAITTNQAFEQFVGKPFQLKKVEFSLLMIVMANEAIAPKRLARALAVTSPTLTLLLDRLQQRGLISRERNPADGRSQQVVIGSKGARIVRDAMTAAELMERQLKVHFSRAEHAMLIELLDKLAKAQGTADRPLRPLSPGVTGAGSP